jgi:hypothetical protein
MPARATIFSADRTKRNASPAAVVARTKAPR